MLRIVLVFATVMAAGTEVVAQAPVRPVVTNGQVTDHAVAGALGEAVTSAASRAGDVAWVGYAVPMTGGDHHMCCWSGDGGDCCGACALEPGATRAAGAAPAPAAGSPRPPVRLEPSRSLIVMARVDGGRIERIRTFSEECRLDAGGRAVRWLTNVRPADSVRWLSGLATATAERRVVDGAVGALGLHADPAALDWLLDAARTSSAAHVRGQALFWLSQRAEQRAVGVIAEAVERDPDTDVKKRAVFALSQLPADEGVPRLITVARGHSNKAVQKQAFFWLGQSKDPRALAFFAEVLAR